MLEILALILLCNVNSKNAVKRGRKPGAFVLLTLVLWIGVIGAYIEIANELVLRPGTVKNLVSLLLSKTNCVSRAQLARYAIDHHLVD